MRNIDTYTALIYADGTEPAAETGYARAASGKTDAFHLHEVPYRNTIVFPEIREPGCGLVAGYAIYNSRVGGDLLYLWYFDTPVNVHAGTVPVIHNGKLFLGVDVSANINIISANEHSM